MSCFEVTPDFAVKFEYQKGEIPIKSMEAGFNKDQQNSDFFIEFEDQIHDNELELSFQAQHAKGVNVMTFPNDNGKSASDALLHVMAVQDKYGVKITRGVFPASLKKSFEAQKAAQDKKVLEQEFNEKTQAAEKASLDEFKSKLGEVHDEVQGLGHFQQGIRDDVLSVGNDVQSYGVKMEAGFEDVKQEVRSFIPDFQERIKQLEKEVDYHKTQRDVQEGKTAAQTTKLNKSKEVVASRDDEIAALRKREEAHVKREEGLLGRIQELERILQVSKAIELLKEMTQSAHEERMSAQEDRAFARAERAELKHSIAEVQESAKILGDMLSVEEERVAKRPRA